MIGFVGLSHLGLVSGVGIASKGFKVVGYDPNASLIASLRDGILPVHEPDLDGLLAKSKGDITFTSDIDALKSCDVVYVALDVATDHLGASDLGPIRALIAKVAGVLDARATLVILSQVPPGFTRALAPTIKAKLYYQVETLIFGRAVERTLHPERYIVGCSDPGASLPEPFARLLGAFGCPVLPMRYESAELAKISINFCLVSSISVANTLAELCERIGADWSEIAPSLKLDKRIGPHSYLSPGLGIAGGNLERDLATVISLAKEHGSDCGVVEAWINNSRYRRDWALRTLHETLLSVETAPRIGVWGLAYKQDTKSTKNSPSLALLESLKGVPVRAYDPQVELGADARLPDVTQVSTALEAANGVRALVVMTPWKEFSTADLKAVRGAMAGDLLIDPYAVLDPSVCKSLGFKYFKLGRAEC